MKRLSLVFLVLATLVYGLGAAIGVAAPHCQGAKTADGAAPTAAGPCKQGRNGKDCPHAVSKECPCGDECKCAMDKKDCTCDRKHEGKECKGGEDCPCLKEAKDSKGSEGCSCGKKT